MWNLFVTVLALQLACTLQAPTDNGGGAEMLMKMMMQQMQGGGYSRDDEEDHYDVKDLIREYMEKHDLDEHDEPGPHMLKQYTEIMQHVIGWHEMMQAGDLVTKSLLKDLVTNPESPGDFAKTLVLKSIHSMVEPADHKKHVMAKIFEYVMAHPHGENTKMAIMLLKRLAAKLNDHDKGVLRVMMLHYMTKSRGEHLEVLKDLLYHLMSDETASNMQGNEMLLLLIQQYLSMQDMGEDKKTMGLVLLRMLDGRKDTEGRALMRHMITMSLMATNHDQPEDEHWKYRSPGPCEVRNGGGQTLSSKMCPQNLSCNVGPVNYAFNNARTFFMCDYPSYLFPYHACKVEYPNGQIESRESNCGEATCDFGPFVVNGDGGETKATFCSDYANYTINITTWDPVILRACALEDSTGHRGLQRRCPYGTKCGGPRLPTMWGNYSLNAYLCYDMERSDKKEDFMGKILETSLGFWEDMDSEEGSHESMDDDDMPMDGEMDSDFLQYIIAKLWSDEQKEDMDDMEEDPDIKPFKVMAYLVHKMADDNELLMKFMQNLKTKHMMGIVDDADRVFMHGIIRHLLAIWFKEQRGEKRQDGDLEDLLAWIMHKKEMMGRKREMEGESGDFVMKIKQMLMEKHADHHEELEEKIQTIYKMLKSHKEEDSDEGSEEMDFDVIKMLFEKMMQK